MGGRGIPRAEDRLAPDRHLTPLAVRGWGEPRAGTTLVYWPGLNALAHVHLVSAAPELAARSRMRVLAVEPPGWGTPALAPEEYRPSALARRVVALLDSLELDRAVFTGWSWGATIGCHLAALASRRLEGLVLLDAGYTDFQDRPDYQRRTLAESIAALRERTPRYSDWSEIPQAARSGFHERNGAIVPLVEPETVAAAAYGVAIEPPSATLGKLARLDLPILLVAATETVGHDWGARALDRFRTAVPSADVVEIGSGHDLLADARTETLAAVCGWLDAHTRSG